MDGVIVGWRLASDVLVLVAASVPWLKCLMASLFGVRACPKHKHSLWSEGSCVCSPSLPSQGCQPSCVRII
ncbi:hypothetical protein GQ44DRAFT_696285 [Phaeosphaeriaceae sp. PMI808]|nr:hypothetical protein GQ44DRAFT_696285 [Phaeosphaeriaceae sp. PMI808]